MNGALYISFFQGQLESALEQVVQLAVQEITKTVGASLNLMLLDAATKDQENQRLRSQLQSRGHGCAAKGSVSDASGERGDTNAADEGTKPEQHTPRRSTDCGLQTDSIRLDQKRRAVGQLKVVMEQVLEFAVCELTRIVEDSFDDVLLELDKTEREQMELMEQIQAMAEEHGTVSAEAQELEGRPDSASSSEAATQESNRVYDRTTAKERGKEQAGDNNGDELRSPSMLHRLLTLPSQLLEGDGESADGLPNLTEPEEPCATASPAAASAVTLEQSTHPLPRGKLNNEDDEEEEEEGEDDPKALGTYTDQSSRSKGGRKVHVCKECGRKFGRVHLLKAHRQAHRETTTQCPQCGKSFSQLAKLQSHLRTHSGKTT